MSQTNFLLLHVSDPTVSAAFYSKLLGRPAIEASPTFAMFALDGGLMLGLWARHTVQPASTSKPGASEMAFALESDSVVDERHHEWIKIGIPVLQAPVRMDFGYTCVAADPDGHRVRVFAPGQE
jgi:predicted lactoylglutathione lyase